MRAVEGITNARESVTFGRTDKIRDYYVTELQSKKIRSAKHFTVMYSRASAFAA